MERLFGIITGLLKPSVKLRVYSDLTQHLVGSDNMILWNEDPSKIDRDTYNEFKEAIKKRGRKYYFHNNLLPYVDFCIALISCLGYSLNHTVILNISDRTFIAAWRTIKLISETGTDNVSRWLLPLTAGRSSEGYCSTLNVVLGNIPNIVDSGDINTENSEGITKHARILESLSLRENVTELKRDADSVDDIGFSVHRSRNTPEGHLYDLITISSFVQHIT